MKNKALLYVLIPLVFGVWGLIFYRVYIRLNGCKDTFADNSSVNQPQSISVKDSFVLELNYRDPFLDGRKGLNIEDDGLSIDNKAVPIEIAKSTFKGETPIANVKYKGLIYNVRKKSKTGLFLIEQKMELVHEGEKKSNLKVLTISNDSAVVWLKDKKLVLAKK